MKQRNRTHGSHSLVFEARDYEKIWETMPQKTRKKSGVTTFRPLLLVTSTAIICIALLFGPHFDRRDVMEAKHLGNSSGNWAEMIVNDFHQASKRPARHLSALQPGFEFQSVVLGRISKEKRERRRIWLQLALGIADVCQNLAEGGRKHELGSDDFTGCFDTLISCIALTERWSLRSWPLGLVV